MVVSVYHHGKSWTSWTELNTPLPARLGARTVDAVVEILKLEHLLGVDG